MTFYRWAETTRTTLNRVLPHGTVVIVIGATEQHGPHLPTGTDFLTAEAVAVKAAQRAGGAGVDVVLAPTLSFGASDHHLPFGGTISLRTETVTQVLADVLHSVSAGGGQRALIVNGHGGNRGPCHSASALASIRDGLDVGYVDYWSLIPVEAGTNYPGHAGAFETSLIGHLHPTLVTDVPPGDGPRPFPDVAGLVLHSRRVWQAIDGYTDQPAAGRADDGARWLEAGVAALAAKIIDFDRTFSCDDN
jgi:creatinine amidohydrolase